jgi:GNAT superfamily N-acetyltransferase
MKIEVRHSCAEFNSYRSARVKSLFNAESGASFNLDAELPIEDDKWRIGLIVGPSGSGKTSMGRKIFGPEAFYEPTGWPSDKPVIDAIAPDGDFNAVTGALAAVGLGSVPTWLRPYPVLSNGEKFRADLAKIICDAPARVVVDEFTSVVDRQIAKFGALAFQKSWKRLPGQCVLLSCHYDIIEWVEPDWVFDTATGQYSGRSLWRRPRFDVDIWETNWRYWHLFEPHYYLKLHKMIAGTNYVGVVDGELVSHLCVSPRPGLTGCRSSRMVVMPEWQGAGIGMRFLNAIAEKWLAGENRFKRKMPMLFHTSHPGLCAGLRRDPKWRQISAMLFGENKTRSATSMLKHGKAQGTGYGGHMRAIQGFEYIGLCKYSSVGKRVSAKRH